MTTPLLCYADRSGEAGKRTRLQPRSTTSPGGLDWLMHTLSTYRWKRGPCITSIDASLNKNANVISNAATTTTTTAAISSY